MTFQGAIISLFISIVCICSAADFSERNEGFCSRLQTNPGFHKINEDSKINVTSENEFGDLNATTWYIPMWSKYEVYKTASMLSGISIDDLTEDDIKRSCITFTQEPGIVMHGFKDKQFGIVSAPGKYGGLLWKVKGESKYRAETWVIFGTQDTFAGVTCWTNGNYSFSVGSKTKKIEEKTRQFITDKLESLGFKSKYFYDYTYENCDV